MKTQEHKTRYYFVGALLILVATLVLKDHRHPETPAENTIERSVTSTSNPNSVDGAGVPAAYSNGATQGKTLTRADSAVGASGAVSAQPRSQGAPPAVATKPMSTGEFEHLTQAALATLPKSTEVRTGGATEAHHLSPQVIAKVQILAEVVEAVAGNPGLESRAMDFYQTCAQDGEFLVSVRARCLAHLKALADKRSQAIDLAKYPADVQRLANYIP